jgi:hypothetical protein
MDRSTDQSINQSMDHSIKKWTDRRINQSINQPMDHSSKKWTGRRINQSINQWTIQSRNGQVNGSINQSINEPFKREMDRSTDQSINQSIDQSSTSKEGSSNREHIVPVTVSIFSVPYPGPYRQMDCASFSMECASGRNVVIIV